MPFTFIYVGVCTTNSIMKNGPLNIILRKRNFINRNFLIYSFPYICECPRVDPHTQSYSWLTDKRKNGRGMNNRNNYVSHELKWIFIIASRILFYGLFCEFWGSLIKNVTNCIRIFFWKLCKESFQKKLFEKT